MQINKAGEYELNYTATDDCGNETSEVRTVLVAREIEAGDNVTLEQDGSTVIINADTYSKAQILQMIGDLQSVSIKLVQALPQTGESNIIYLVPKQGDAGNVKDEYIWVENAWELIGNTEIDLTDYYTKDEVDAELAEKADKDNFRVVSGSSDNLTIRANTNTTFQVPLAIPDGYTLAAYRQIAVQNATNGGANATEVMMRWFGSANGGKSANVALKNPSSLDAIIKIEVVALAVKQ